LSEEQLILRIKEDPKHFGIVYDQYYAAIFNYVYKRTGNFDVSRDITSETFLKAFLNIGKFSWRGISLLHWLYRISTNEINLHYRSGKYRPVLLSEMDQEDLYSSFDQSPDLLDEKTRAEREFEKYEQFVKVQQALARIPLKYQTVISLKYFEKLKIREIGEVLKKPEGTIKSLLSRGISLLKREL